MSYQFKFSWQFRYNTEEDALKALQVIDDEEINPDDAFERNSLMRENFKINEDGTVLNLNLSGSMSARSWYGSRRVLCKMSAKTVDGKITCSFEDEADDVVHAGRGWS